MKKSRWISLVLAMCVAGAPLPGAGGWLGNGQAASAAGSSLGLNHDADLVAHWSFDEINAGTGMVANLADPAATLFPSGSGANAGLTEGRYGTVAALITPATKAFHADAPRMSSINETQAFTLTATVRLDALNDWNGLLSSPRVNFKGSGVGIFADANEAAAPGAGLEAGEWSTIAITYDEGASEIFVNGVSQAVKEHLPPLAMSTTFHVGSLGGWAQLNGAIDDLRYYKRVLSDAEIGALANDATAPSAPGNPRVVSATSNSILLGWEASADDVGTKSYEVYDGDAEAPAAVVTEPAVLLEGLRPGDHAIRVIAKDEAGNASQAAELTASTQGGADAVPPSAPSELTVAGTTDQAVTLQWKESEDNGTVAAYHIYEDGNDTQIKSIDAPAARSLYAFDSGAQGLSTNIQGATVSHETSIRHAGSGSVKVAYGALTDNPETAANEQYFEAGIDSPAGIDHAGGVLTAQVFVPETTDLQELGFGVFGDGWNWNGEFMARNDIPKGEWFPIKVALKGEAPSPRLYFMIGSSGAPGVLYIDSVTYSQGKLETTIDGLDADTAYSFAVKAEDAAGNLSPASNAVEAATLTPDTEAPTAPGALTVAAVSNTNVSLTWTKSSDNREVADYLIYVNGASDPAATIAASPSGATVAYTLYGLTPKTDYSFTVKARDVSGLVSASSNAAEATTAEFVSNETSSLGINLTGVSDWTTQQPFKDVFKTSRGWNNDAADHGLDLDEHGWVKSLQPGQTAFSLLLVTDEYEGGEYVLLYDGEGEFAFDWDARFVSEEEPGRILFNAAPGTGGGIRITITETNPDNYIRNIRVMKPKYEDNYLEEPFTREFLDMWGSFKVIRFMDFMRTNESEQESWSNRPTPEDFRQASNKGVALEYLVGLSNELNTDPWFNMPTKADDDYIRRFAEAVKADLNPELKIYVEWSNETWNSGFEAHHYAAAEGKKLGYTGSDMEISFKFHAHRAKRIFEIWADVFEDEPDRIVNVLGAFHHGGSYHTNIMLNHENVFEVADAVAIAPYFGGNYGSSKAEQVKDWSMDELFADMPGELAFSNGKAKEVIDAAARKGIATFAYEGGQHLVGTYYNGIEYYHDDELTAKLIQANRDPRMGQMYSQYLKDWKDMGGRLMMVFASMAEPSKWGSWGIIENEFQDPGTAPKYKAVMDFIATTPKWWDDNVPPAVDPEEEDELGTAEPKKTEAAIEIDGDVGEDVWEIEEQVKLAVNGTPDNEAKFGLLWDDEYLYVGVQVKDASIVKDSEHYHEDDSVEVYIDGDHDKAATYDNADDRQFIVRAGDDQLFERAGNTEGVLFGYQATDDGYSVEVAIPWSNIGVDSPQGGVTTLGLDIGVNDDDDGATRESQLLWSGNGDNWRSTEKFGDIALSSETVGGEPSGPVDPVDPVDPIDTGSQGSGGNAQAPSVSGSVVKTNPVLNGSKAKAGVGLSHIEQALAHAGPNKEIAIAVSPSANASSLELELPVDAFRPSSNGGLKRLNIQTQFGTVTLDADSLSSLAENSRSVTLTIRPIEGASFPRPDQGEWTAQAAYETALLVDGQPAGDLTGKRPALISVPYELQPGERPESVVVYAADGEGNVRLIRNGRFNEATGTVDFYANRLERYAVGSARTAFDDLASVPWALEGIRGLAARGIVEGDGEGTFGPERQVTRAEFVKMLVRTFELSHPNARAPFTDVDGDDWYNREAAVAFELGIAQGYADGSFRGGSGITREEMVAMAARALQAAGIELKSHDGEITLKDMDSVSEYAASDVGLLHRAGIIEGDGRAMFNPLQGSTRAEAAKILYLLFVIGL